MDLRKVKSPTTGLRFHDLRHHAITELAESKASDQTIMAIAGHVSPRMLARYSHVRVEAKRNALDALNSSPTMASKRERQDRADRGGAEESHDANHVTTQEIEGTTSPEIVEKNGRPEWTRTIDLFRVKEAL